LLGHTITSREVNEELFMTLDEDVAGPRTSRADIRYSLTDRNRKPISTSKRSSARISSIDQGQEGQDMQEENLCIICFSEPPNCVFLDCGHGGTCLTCSLDIMERNNSCVLCRETVTQLIEIERKEFKPGMYKVTNSFYVCSGS